MDWEVKAENNTLSEQDLKDWLECRRKWIEKENIESITLKQKAWVRWVLEGFTTPQQDRPQLINRPNNGSPVGHDSSSETDHPDSSSPSVFGLSMAEADALENEFSEAEIWKAVKGCGSTKAPGPDGFNLRFYKKIWGIIQQDLISAINSFWENGVISSGCYASFITLIPNMKDLVCLNDNQPISLLGSYYKIVAKLLSNRLRKVVPKLMGYDQSAFIKGRNIIDGALIENETLYFLKHKNLKSNGVWRVLIGNVKENGVWEKMEEMDSFVSQGLNWLTKSSVANNLFKGVEVGTNKITISLLQYADDMMFFGEWSMVNIDSLLKLLKCFEFASGLNINYNKSNLYGVEVDTSEVEDMARLFGCKVGTFPCTYLGLPIGAKMIKKVNWNPGVNKFEKRLADWKARVMSCGGHLTLVKSVSNRLPLYYFSHFYEKKFGAVRDMAKISWVKWDIVIRLRIDNLGVNLKTSFKIKIGDGKSTSFWNDCWISDVPLKVKLKRLAYLESNINDIIFERVCGEGDRVTGSWRWIRPPTGRTDAEFRELNELIRSAKIDSEKNDSWCWSLGGNGSFATKILADEIASVIFPTISNVSETLRNNLVPKKVEVYVCRAKRKKLPVLSELDKRGIDLHSVRCPLCDDNIETVEHSLIFCKDAIEIWHRVCNWWGMNGFSNLSINDAFCGNTPVHSSALGANIWQAVEWNLHQNQNLTTSVPELQKRRKKLKMARRGRNMALCNLTAEKRLAILGSYGRRRRHRGREM
ncbi:uncharacterized protein [Rutidosis leptorrhynchoides]|uniref:uncharacterized protein n=1 Tax=Rutidosis leptorrhynchoides TaxID=125765 RepID=UPI003A995ADD